jgi:sortase (surface protein transpeptidase)
VTTVSPTATPEQRTSSATDEPSTPTPTPTPTPELRPGPLPNYEAPLRLRIPAIGIDAHVQWVGRDDQGRMGVPSNYTDVAWYEPGPKPGNIGNAVIDGHLDSRDGPAVFYRLGDLQQGADVIVVTSDGIELRFIVDRVERYKTDDVPLSRVFGPSTGQHLNLITCEGTFDWNSRAYDERLVVYTTLAT